MLQVIVNGSQAMHAVSAISIRSRACPAKPSQTPDAGLSPPRPASQNPSGDMVSGVYSGAHTKESSSTSRVSRTLTSEVQGHRVEVEGVAEVQGHRVEVEGFVEGAGTPSDSAPQQSLRGGTRSSISNGPGANKCEVLSITPLDAPLVSPGEGNPFPEGQVKPDLKQGMHFNLANNIWGTNYIMWVPWSEKDVNMAFRFRLEVDRLE
jgi:hypothetical protein